MADFIQETKTEKHTLDPNASFEISFSVPNPGPILIASTPDFVGDDLPDILQRLELFAPEGTEPVAQRKTSEFPASLSYRLAEHASGLGKIWRARVTNLWKRPREFKLEVKYPGLDELKRCEIALDLLDLYLDGKVRRGKIHITSGTDQSYIAFLTGGMAGFKRESVDRAWFVGHEKQLDVTFTVPNPGRVMIDAKAVNPWDEQLAYTLELFRPGVAEPVAKRVCHGSPGFLKFDIPADQAGLAKPWLARLTNQDEKGRRFQLRATYPGTVAIDPMEYHRFTVADFIYDKSYLPELTFRANDINSKRPNASLLPLSTLRLEIEFEEEKPEITGSFEIDLSHMKLTVDLPLQVRHEQVVYEHVHAQFAFNANVLGWWAPDSVISNVTNYQSRIRTAVEEKARALFAAESMRTGISDALTDGILDYIKGKTGALDPRLVAIRVAETALVVSYYDPIPAPMRPIEELEEVLVAR